MSVLLASRGPLTAVDGAAVVGLPIALVGDTPYIWATFAYTANVTPATINIRAGVEISTDGTNWHQIIRFIDQTTVGGAVRIARLGIGGAAGVESGLTVLTLSTSAGAAVLSDAYTAVSWIRAQTMVQALTGASASVNVVVSCSGLPLGAGQT